MLTHGQIIRSRSSSTRARVTTQSTSPLARDSTEDWTRTRDAAERRRLQNMLAQRRYRQKQAAGTSNVEEALGLNSLLQSTSLPLPTQIPFVATVTAVVDGQASDTTASCHGNFPVLDPWTSNGSSSFGPSWDQDYLMGGDSYNLAGKDGFYPNPEHFSSPLVIQEWDTPVMPPSMHSFHP